MQRCGRQFVSVVNKRTLLGATQYVNSIDSEYRSRLENASRDKTLVDLY